MTDVHLLGDVRTGVINHHRLRRMPLLDPHSRIAARPLDQLTRQPGRRKPHVDKPRPRDRDFFGHRPEIQFGPIRSATARGLLFCAGLLRKLPSPTPLRAFAW